MRSAYGLVVCVALSLALPTPSQSVTITEFMASNASTLLDEDGETSDWIELWNGGGAPVDLGGWALTDDVSDPTKWVFPAVVMDPGAYLVVFASDKNRAVAGQELHTNFKLTSTGEYLALIDPVGQAATEFAPQYPPQRVDVAYGRGGTRAVLVAEGASCDVHVPRNGNLGTTWHQGTVTEWLNGPSGIGYERSTGYQGLIATDIEALMYGVNTSAYIRTTFNVTNPAGFQSLALRMKYDDGFAAWLNGVPIASAAAPSTVAWNSAATGSRNEALAVIYENHDVTAALPALNSGANVLAIQGLNATVTSSDLLVVPELVAQSYASGTGYLLTPTPGAGNGATVQGFVSDVTASSDRGIYTAAFNVTLTTPTAGATIRYTTDGSRPSATNGTAYTSPVAITGSTVLRASATLSGFGPSEIITHSYIFPGDVFSQPATVPGLPTTWGGAGSAGPSTTADYEMDPNVISDPEYEPRLLQALQSRPVVCLTMDPTEWLDPSTGLYISPSSSPAVQREAPTSVEYFEPQGSGMFQVNAGVRVTGNGSTWNWSSKKLSLRLLFKSEHGPSRLEYPLFSPPATSSFNTLTLDAYYAFTWNYAPSYNGLSTWRVRWRQAQYMRDWYANLLHEKTGALATHGKYVNVFINGLYWGLFNIHERPDEEFMTTYLGGNPEDWDVIRHNQNNVQAGNNAGWLALMSLVDQGGGSYVQTREGYNAVKRVLDVENLADYMLMNFFIGFHYDWPGSNWYAANNRVDPESKWKMFSWDAEHSLKDVNQNSTQFSTAGSPARPYHRLRQNTEFQVMFGDRVHRAFFNDGPMDGTNPRALYADLASSIEDAMILESARWGDVFTEPANTVNGQWKVERDRILNDYFPRRRAIVLQQLRSLNLYPSVAAPTFSQHGGSVPAGYSLAVTAPSGAIFYTTDGSDPRLEGGAVSPNATEYLGPFAINSTTQVKARVKSGNNWSALNEAIFVVESIVLNELLASNTLGIVDEFGEHEDWIELYNKGLTPAVASGMYLTDNPANPTKWQIPAGQTINPGGTLLIWADEDGSQGPLHANFKLSTSGEQVWLYDTDGQTLLSTIAFGPQVANVSTGWMTDGGGQLLVTFLDPSPTSPNEIQGCGARRYSAQDPTSQPITLSLVGTPGLGQVVNLTMFGGQPNAGHALFAALAPAELALPFSTSKQLLASLGLIAPIVAGPTGTAQFALPVPPLPPLVGVSLFFQDWTLVNSNIVASSGLEIMFCP